MKNVLVTGASGFIGSHLVEALLEKKMNVRCLVRKSSSLEYLAGLDVDYVYGDLTDPVSLLPAVKNMDCVFHLGGRTKISQKEDIFKANALGTEYLIHACLKYAPKLKRFVYVSSQAVMGPSYDGRALSESDPARPISRYGKSKLAAEQIVLQYREQLPATIIRPPSVYGPRDRDFFEMFKMIHSGISATLGLRNRYISIIYVRDLIDGMILAAESSRAVGQTYFLASDTKVAYSELGQHAARAMNRPVSMFRVPLLVFGIAVLGIEVVMKILHQPVVVGREKVQEMKQRYWICDISKAEEELNYHPQYDIRRGIRETAEWYISQGWLG